MTNPGIASVALGVVHAARAGMASGINSTFRQVGIATGVAGLGAIFQARIESRLGELLPQAPAAFADAVSSGAAGRRCSRSAPGARAVVDAANPAFVSGLQRHLARRAGIAFGGSLASGGWSVQGGRESGQEPLGRGPPRARAGDAAPAAA